MNTPAITIGAAPARQSGHVAHTVMKVFFLFSFSLLVVTIIWAVQVQTSKRTAYTEGPGLILNTLVGEGKAHTCKIVSIDETDPNRIEVRVVGQINDSRWQKKGMVLVVKNKAQLEVDDVVLVYRTAGEKIVIEPPSRFEPVLLL